MKGHHRFRQIVFLIIFLIKVTWYEAHCFNHMWLDSPVVPSTTWLCDSPHHLSPRFLTFHLNWISVPMKHHLPFPLPSPSPASPGVNQCNSTKSFYFPFSPPSVFLLFFITKRTWRILSPLTSSKHANATFASDSGEAGRNQESGRSQSPPPRSRGHSMRADIREAEARWPGSNPSSSA